MLTRFPPKHDFISQCSRHMHLVALSTTNIRSRESTHAVGHFQCFSRSHHRWFPNIYSTLSVRPLIIIQKLHVCVASARVSCFAYLLIIPLFVSQPLSLSVFLTVTSRATQDWLKLVGQHINVTIDRIKDLGVL